MNIEEYISSGILEAYALGELSHNEMTEVERMLDQYPILRTELEQIERDLLTIDQSLAIEPPVEVQQKLSQTLFGSLDEKAKSLTIHKSAIKKYQWLAAASIAIAVLASVLAWQYKSLYEKSQQELISILEESDRLSQDFNQTKEYINEYDRLLQKVYADEYEKVSLSGLDLYPSAKALVFWNRNQKEVYISIADLPENEADMQYQLWALVDGQPIDAGVFDASQADLILRLKDIERADAFAVTLEPKGGSQNPTLDQMYLFGKIG